MMDFNKQHTLDEAGSYSSEGVMSLIADVGRFTGVEAHKLGDWIQKLKRFIDSLSEKEYVVEAYLQFHRVSDHMKLRLNLSIGQMGVFERGSDRLKTFVYTLPSTNGTVAVEICRSIVALFLNRPVIGRLSDIHQWSCTENFDDTRSCISTYDELTKELTTIVEKGGSIELMRYMIMTVPATNVTMSHLECWSPATLLWDQIQKGY